VRITPSTPWSCDRTVAAICAVFSMLVGVGATLTMIVLLLAGSPNSTPAQMTQIKMLMLGMAVCGLVCVVGAIWAMVAGRHGLAAGVGIGPMVVAIVMFIVLLVVILGTIVAYFFGT